MARGGSQINVNLALNTEQLEAGQKRAIRQFQKLGGAGDTAKSGLKALGGGLKTVGVLGTAMAGSVGFASKKLIDLASDSEESANAFGVTFKSASDELNKFVDSFSTKAGFTTAELQELLSFTGGVVNGMGASADASAEFSKQVAELSGDIGSLRNKDPEQVLRAITSALTGEREALKGVGVIIKETDVQQKALTMTNKNAVSELTKMEKAEATLQLIREQSADAIGDLDRTSDGFANTQRRLKAELRETATEMGEALMPTVAELLPVISDLAEKVLPRLVEMFQNGVKAVREFMAEFGDDILRGLQRGFQAFKDIGVIVGEAIKRVIEFIKNNKILSKIFKQLGEDGAGFLDSLNDIANGIRAENEAEKKANRRREERSAQYRKNTEGAEDLTEATEDLTDEIEDNTDSIEDNSDELQYGAVEFD
jgi:molecular chaperone GrpE (heat shock protein)